MIKNNKIIGIICECNPFHKGHKLLIEEAKKKGDIIIAIMSGNYVQRGEPSVYDKYERTKTLLKNGISLVIELPVEFVLSPANIFAFGSINILNNLNFVDEIIFGSNCNDIEKLESFSSKIIYKENSNSSAKENNIKNLAKKGLTFPKIAEIIYGEALSPNDILGVEYIRAIKKLNSNIKYSCIKRNDNFKSATELRKNIIPKITCDSFSDILSYKIFDCNSNFTNISNITNELNNAILKTSHLNISFNERALLLKKKNRTLSQIKRSFFNIIFNINENDINYYNFNKKYSYIRILGIAKKNEYILKSIPLPYLLSYSNKAFENFYNNYKNNSSIEKIDNLDNSFIINNKSILYNIYSSNLYYLLSNDITKEAEKIVIKI